jgi:hypothetical protein
MRPGLQTNNTTPDTSIQFSAGLQKKGQKTNGGALPKTAAAAAAAAAAAVVLTGAMLGSSESDGRLSLRRITAAKKLNLRSRPVSFSLSFVLSFLSFFSFLSLPDELLSASLQRRLKRDFSSRWFVWKQQT